MIERLPDCDGGQLPNQVFQLTSQYMRSNYTVKMLSAALVEQSGKHPHLQKQQLDIYPLEQLDLGGSLGDVVALGYIFLTVCIDFYKPSQQEEFNTHYGQFYLLKQ